MKCRSMPFRSERTGRASCSVGQTGSLWFPVIIAAFFIASCSRQVDNQFVDRSFLTGEPCPAPCWYGLKPGVSTKQEVLATLEQLVFVDKSSIREYGNVVWPGDENARAIYFDCVAPEGKQCGDAVISRGELKSLLLFVRYELTLAEVVNILGSPAYIDSYPRRPSGFFVDFIWTQKNIEVSTDMSDRQVMALRAGEGLPEDLLIKWVLYSTPERFHRGPSEDTTRVPWPGFAER